MDNLLINYYYLLLYFVYLYYNLIYSVMLVLIFLYLELCIFLYYIIFLECIKIKYYYIIYRTKNHHLPIVLKIFLKLKIV